MTKMSRVLLPLVGGKSTICSEPVINKVKKKLVDSNRIVVASDCAGVPTDIWKVGVSC